jgi:hypothetical protein
MPIQWYYSHAGQKVVGPCSSSRIRLLAGSGQLLPSDMLRGGRIAGPIKAGRLKGLAFAPKP